jgi:hypothetical protein
MLYLLDASVLITANNSYYGIDRVPEFWEWLHYHASAGRVKIPLEIYEEIKDGPKDEDKDLLFGWLQNKDNQDALVLAEQVDETLVRHAVTVGYAPDLTDDEVEQLGRDPFLLSYALANPTERCIVTAEGSKPKRKRQNRHLPDVCKTLGLKSCDIFTLNKALVFRTGWKKATE